MISWNARINGLGQNVWTLQYEGEYVDCLMQTRSYDDDTDRYLIGIVVPDLRRVAQFIAWFENEGVAYRIPAEWLCELLDKCIEAGTAAFTHDGRNWRVDFHLDEDTLSPQQSFGERYPIGRYRIDIPKSTASP